MVPFSEIEANDYNLNIPRYIDSSDPEDLHDLDAHLRGGIPQRDVDDLHAYWEVFPSLCDTLFAPGNRSGYLMGRVEPRELKRTIQDNVDFQTYAGRVRDVFVAWQTVHKPTLYAITQGSQPNEIIHALADDLLERYADISLLDGYDVYQRLMTYWTETMQDDLYLISAEGWVEAARPRPIIQDKEKKIQETPDLVIGRRKIKTDLIPPALIVARYFFTEQAELERLQAAADMATSELDAFIEEHSGEEGLLADATTDTDKVTKSSVRARIKELQQDSTPDDDEELVALRQCLALFDAKAQAENEVKAAQSALDERTLAHYGKLTEDDIKSLVIEDKWLAALQASINEEVARVAQRLTARVKELEERYAEPLPSIEAEVDELSKRVAGHLARMGLVLE